MRRRDGTGRGVVAPGGAWHHREGRGDAVATATHAQAPEGCMAARPRPALGPLLGLLLGPGVAAPPGHAEPRIYPSSWAVRVAAGPREAGGLARRHGLICLGQVMEEQPYYHFKHRGTRQKALSRHWGWNIGLTKEPKLLWFEQQSGRSKRSVSVVPTDPWFHKQWYMNNDINPDLNILTAWSRGYTGLGVALTTLDDGIEKDHPDLAANYDPLASYDFNSNDPHPQPRYPPSDENRCAGEAAAAANNRICGAGVAYNAKVGAVRMLDGPITDMVEARSLSLRSQRTRVYSASWGAKDNGKTVDGPGVLAVEAFSRGVTKVSSALAVGTSLSGNGGLNRDNCNCNGYADSIYTLWVGSVLAGSRQPWYGESCSASLTTTYSSRTMSEGQIVTTDLHHRCTDKHTGTSASAPLAAGTIALTLEANPALTWRDVQHLVIRSSRAEDWARNSVGRKASHHYGYGLLDAGRPVEMAKAWPGTRPQRSCSVKAPHAAAESCGLQEQAMLPGKRAVPHGSCAVSCAGGTRRIRSLEHVQVRFSLSYSRRGGLAIALTSPTGTTATVLTVRLHWPLVSVQGGTAKKGVTPGLHRPPGCHSLLTSLSPSPYDTSQGGYKDWTFMPTRFWDENPDGTGAMPFWGHSSSRIPNPGEREGGCPQHRTLSLLAPGQLTSFTLHLHSTDEDMPARPSAAPAVATCVRRDAQGVYEECGGSLYAFQRSCLLYRPPRRYGSARNATTRVCASCHPSCYACQGACANACIACVPPSPFDELTRSCSPPWGSPL
ncbi:LOW QUALITY PROTEIN: proprotein convertase subtilisin/kexin type 4 [Rhynochetos jubatus]